MQPTLRQLVDYVKATNFREISKDVELKSFHPSDLFSLKVLKLNPIKVKTTKSIML